MRKIKFLLPAVIVGALIVFAGCSQGVAKGNGPKGSPNRTVDVSRGGSAAEGLSESRANRESDLSPVIPASLTKLEGRLVYDDPEWLLDIDGETVALFLGNRSYLESLEIELKEGTETVAFGVMEEDGLSVARLVTEDGEIVLRSDAGVPKWAGNGNRGQGQSAPMAESEETAEGSGYQGEGRGSGEGTGQGAARGTGNGAGRGNGTGRGGGQSAGRSVGRSIDSDVNYHAGDSAAHVAL